MVVIRPLRLVFLMLGVALVAPAMASAEPTTRIIVKRDTGLSAAEQRDIRADAGVRLVDTLRLPRTEVVAAPARDASAALRKLNADPDVVYAEPDRRLYAFADPPPDLTSVQWPLNNTGQPTPTGEVDSNGHPITVVGTAGADMNVFQAWNTSTGSGQIVAVVDSGVWADHPDLSANVLPGYDWVDKDTDPTDVTGHGTHVAGIIAALHEDISTGIAGVAPKARILPLRVLGNTKEGNASDAAQAFDFAGDQGVRVVNASLGHKGFSTPEYQAIRDHPVTLYVTAAGNGGANDDSNPVYPCAYSLQNIICVGASDANDQVPAYSNVGKVSVDLFAPGDRILSTGAKDSNGDYGYAIADGTSAAAPHIAGEAALLLARDPALTLADLKDKILQTGDQKSPFIGKSVTGKRANAEAALAVTPPDRDGDTVPDATDNCPTVTNPDQTDANPANGIGDACESETIATADSDGDTVPDSLPDECPYLPGSPALAGCPGMSANQDTDAWLDAFDNCPTVSNPDQADLDHDGIGDACDTDLDNDGRPNVQDNCDRTYNPTQANTDGDSMGDACDPDDDNDFRPDTADACPTVKAFTPNGCPPVVKQPADADKDGFVDSADACPLEYAKTVNGCPLPVVTELSARGKKRRGKRSATVSVRASRAAVVEVTIQRRRCSYGKCRWVRVTRKTTSTVGGRATVGARRLTRGSYRAVVVLSSAAGRAAAETQRFRVR